MSKIYASAAELIGNTPLIEFNNIEKKYGLKARVLAKLEYLNPAGSVKDRVAREMIETAEREGRLKAGATIIEPTSGNTGIGLAAIAAAKGYRTIIVLPETMSVERRNIIKAYGAEIVLTEGSKGMTGAIEKASELQKEIPDSIIAGQFVNPANPAAHLKTTGPEIWNDTDGEIDAFVAGVGTGGTVTGVGQYLKNKKENIEIIAVEPSESPVLSQGKAGAHKIQGIGAGFVPQILDTDIYNNVVPVENQDAFDTAKEIARTEGIQVGISSGAALWAAMEWAKKEENEGKTVVVLLPDSGDRYYSTALFQE
ncbi:MAG: cysteine synthase A [Eubacteriales bacterium]|nr:cysteine synthase A [Eubacteriales bacterium]